MSRGPCRTNQGLFDIGGATRTGKRRDKGRELFTVFAFTRARASLRSRTKSCVRATMM